MEASVRPYLEQWYATITTYLSRCVNTFGEDIKYLVHAVSFLQFTLLSWSVLNLCNSSILLLIDWISFVVLNPPFQALSDAKLEVKCSQQDLKGDILKWVSYSFLVDVPVLYTYKSSIIILWNFCQHFTTSIQPSNSRVIYYLLEDFHKNLRSINWELKLLHVHCTGYCCKYCRFVQCCSLAELLDSGSGKMPDRNGSSSSLSDSGALLVDLADPMGTVVGDLDAPTPVVTLAVNSDSVPHFENQSMCIWRLGPWDSEDFIEVLHLK